VSEHWDTCPVCKKKVGEYAHQISAPATEGKYRFWHYDCWRADKAAVEGITE
jgi:hypothetical protein